MNNKRRLFSTVLCVAALTAGLFVSGCGSDKAGGIGSVVSSVVDGGDEKAAAKLNTTAFYNLGVYYYSKKNKQKSKFYFKVAKENGYDIGEIFDAYLTN